ncbi:hypothetical protein MTO96_045826, partial [Rhipicephalus appendiculatus]
MLSYDSTLPASWETLRKLPRLKTLGLVKMSGLRLGRDFGLLPRTVRGVSVLHSSVESVEDGWLAELPDLEYVVIRDSKLPLFSRSMLPTPALKLRSIDLDYNDLSAIPAGFGDGFPALAFLDLEGNKITTIEERELAGVLNDTSTVVLLGSAEELIGVTHPTVSNIIHEVEEAIIVLGKRRKLVDFALTPAAKVELKAGFARRGTIPGVLACVDGTLVAIQKPEGLSIADTASFTTRKGYYALNVMIVCDADLRILVIDPRFPGSCHDSWVWRHNPLWKCLASQLQLGEHVL